MKKVLALILVFVMCVGMCISVCADESEFSRLGELKIIQGDQYGNWNLEKAVTRAELMQFAINSLNLRVASSGSPDAGFNDMNKHWAKNAVNTAVQMKLVEKSELFSPEGTVTVAEAIKMVVQIMGYEPMATSMGGTEQAYIVIASQVGLTNGLTLSAESVALRKDVASLILNALDIPIMQQTGFGEQPEFKIADGKDGGEKITLSDSFK